MEPTVTLSLKEFDQMREEIETLKKKVQEKEDTIRKIVRVYPHLFKNYGME